MISIISGFVAGLVHVFSGPDHLAAVAPLSVDEHEDGWGTGARWGLGHSAGVVLVGAAAALFKELLPVEPLSHWAERLVGVMLIGIGIWGIRKGLRNHVHIHAHAHGGEHHAHIHVHDPNTAHARAHSNAMPHRHSHAAFAIGAMHGLAGSSHFLGVLPALAFPTLSQAIGYLAAYGAGTILAMAVFCSAVGGLAKRFEFAGSTAYRILVFSCSAAAIGVGGFWLLA